MAHVDTGSGQGRIEDFRQAAASQREGVVEALPEVGEVQVGNDLAAVVVDRGLLVAHRILGERITQAEGVEHGEAVRLQEDARTHGPAIVRLPLEHDDLAAGRRQ